MKRDTFKKLFLVAGLVAIVFVGMSALGPRYTEVERFIFVEASQAKAFQYLMNLEHLKEWHFWNIYDPEMEHSTSGPKSAKGSVYHWTGNEFVGKGQMKISKADPNRFIEFNLEYLEPWEAKATNYFRIEQKDDGSIIFWGFKSENSFISRMSMLFMDMDKLLGADYEKGLIALKKKIEED